MAVEWLDSLEQQQRLEHLEMHAHDSMRPDAEREEYEELRAARGEWAARQPVYLWFVREWEAREKVRDL